MRISVVPLGLRVNRTVLIPQLKLWAIVARPSGTSKMNRIIGKTIIWWLA